MSVELGAIGSWSTSPRPSDPGACSPDGRSKLIPTPPQSRCDPSFGNRESAPLSALPMQVTGGPGRFSSFGIGVKRRPGLTPAQFDLRCAYARRGSGEPRRRQSRYPNPSTMTIGPIAPSPVTTSLIVVTKLCAAPLRAEAKPQLSTAAVWAGAPASATSTETVL